MDAQTSRFQKQHRPTSSRRSLSAPTSAYVVIPARTASTRLPNKLLLRDTGRSVLEHTYLAACQARRPQGVCIAAADAAIAADASRFGGRFQMTRTDLPSGTDRVAAVARSMPHISIFVNVQGDEPEIDPDQIDQLIELLEADPSAAMATLAVPITERERLEDPACVKVVVDSAGRALYFSRSPIPHPREWSDDLLTCDPPLFWQHLGIYAYRRDFLLQFGDLPASRLESIESLEQLRVLEAGHPIRVGFTQHAARGIDTWDDYRAFVSRAKAC